MSTLLRADAPVVAVADAQHDGGEQGGEQRAGQDADLDVVVRAVPAPKASSPISSETVNPMPASSARPRTSLQLSPSASWARVNRCTSQVAAEHADGLADDQTGDDAEGDRVGEARAEPAGADDRDPGGEEREHRHRDPGGERPEAVLEVLGQPGVRAPARGGPPAR